MDAVLNWLWQGGVVAVALRVMLLALERARANVRYIVCWAAALFVIILPALPQLASSAVSHDAFSAAPVDAFVSLPDTWWMSTVVVLAAWTLWGSVTIVKFVSAIVAIRRARASARAFPSHIESVMPHWCRVRSEGRRATLVLSDSVTTAAVLGWGAPMIAIAPSLMTMLDPDELDRVLIHEWAHVQRRDDQVNILQVVIYTVVGWHPALWWIDHRLHIEREIACDEMTVAVTGSPKSYAACLMKLASFSGTGRRLQPEPAVLTSSGLRARLLKIVSRRSALAPVWSRSIAAAIVTTLCLMSVALGGLKLVEAAELALPFVSSRTLDPSMVRPVTATVATLSSDRQTAGHSPRAREQGEPRDRPQAEPSSPSLQSEPEPNVPPALALPGAGDDAQSPGVAELDAEHALEEQTPTVAPTTPPTRSDVTAEQPQSPWSAAAAGGAAIGRKSKEAGVATAGFFSRFARRVAGSF